MKPIVSEQIFNEINRENHVSEQKIHISELELEKEVVNDFIELGAIMECYWDFERENDWVYLTIKWGKHIF